VRFRRSQNRPDVLFLLDCAWPTKRRTHQPIQDNKHPMEEKPSHEVQSRKRFLLQTRTCDAIAHLRPSPSCYTPSCGAFQHPAEAGDRPRSSSNTTEASSTPARTSMRAAHVARGPSAHPALTHAAKTMTHRIHLHVMEQWGTHEAPADHLDLAEPFPTRGVPGSRALEQHARIVRVARPARAQA